MFYPNKSRRLMWPISLKWSAATTSRWFRQHGWQVGSERCSAADTSDGCMPGYRAVFGWTLHLGQLKVVFGRERVGDCGCAVQDPMVA